MKKDTTGHSFEAFFKRATSPLAVLSLLSERPMYGYEITQELSRRSGGRYFPPLPVLYRAAEQAIRRTGRRWTSARTYYAVTPEGAAYLSETARNMRLRPSFPHC
ncbi:MAG: PadR family transcriptional regulator [Oscillospiraceae bacterium]